MRATDRLLDAIAELLTRRRGAVLVSVLALTVAAGFFLPRIEADPSPEGLVARYGDQEAVAARLRELSGDTDRVIVILLRSDDVLADEVLAHVAELSRHFADEPFVDRVESLTTIDLPRRDASDDEALTLEALEEEEPPEEETDPDVLNALDAIVRADPERFPGGLAQLSESAAEVTQGSPIGDGAITDDALSELRRALADAPLVTGRLVNEEHTVTAVVVRLSESVREWDALAAAVADADGWLAENPPPPGTTRITGGLPHLRTAVVDKMISDQMVLVPITLVVCLVLLFLSFRWLPATFLPIVAVGASAVIVVGAMAALREPMNILNNLIPALLIIIGVTDSIHLLNRYREETRVTSDRREAAKRTVRTMMVACFLTSATTAVGLGSLVVSETELLRRFAVTAAAGVMIAYVVTIGFLPPAITAFRAPPAPRSGSFFSGILEKAIVDLTRAVIRRPWTVLAGAAALLALSVFVGSGIEVDTALMDHFDEDDEVFEATILMDEELEGVRPLEVLLTSDTAGRFRDPEVLAAVDSAAAWASDQRGVLRATSVPTYLRETYYLITGDPETRAAPLRSREQIDALATLLAQREPDPLASFLSADGRTLRIEVRMQDVGAQRTIAMIDDLRAHLRERLPDDVGVTMTGEAYTGSVAVASVVRDLLGSLATAVVVIFGMLTLLFRSVRLGLLSIPPNVIPLALTLAWMVERAMPLNIATAIIFSVSLGLAVDGTIHVLARYREERGEGHSVDDALLRAAAGTGRAIVVSSITLMLGFLVLLLSAFVPVRHFGELVAVTVASCLVATLIVQPALLKVGTK